jgi:hypothetical protein
VGGTRGTSGESERCLQGFGWEAQREEHWEDLGIGGRMTLRRTLGRYGSMGRTGFGWLKTESNGELLWTQ